jgi:DNA-binding Xre family transcriptional regulator
VPNEMGRKQILNEKDITLEELKNKIFFYETRISVLTNGLAEKAFLQRIQVQSYDLSSLIDEEGKIQLILN